MEVKTFLTHICRDASKKYKCIHTYVEIDLCYVINLTYRVIHLIHFIYIHTVQIVKIIIVVLHILW